MRDDIIECGDDIADSAVTSSVEHLQHGETGAGGDARAGAARVEAVARDDPGDMRAVAVVVVWRRMTVDKIHELVDALRARGRRSDRRATTSHPNR